MNDKLTPDQIASEVGTAKFSFPFAIMMKSAGRDDEADKAWARGMEALETLAAAYPRPEKDKP